MRALLLIALMSVSLNAMSEDFLGEQISYKPAEHSSAIHNSLKGDAAREFYNLMVKVPEREIPSQKLIIRRSKSMECINYYGAGYYECLFQIDESGDVQGGYSGN